MEPLITFWSYQQFLNECDTKLLTLRQVIAFSYYLVMYSVCLHAIYLSVDAELLRDFNQRAVGSHATHP